MRLFADENITILLQVRLSALNGGPPFFEAAVRLKSLSQESMQSPIVVHAIVENVVLDWNAEIFDSAHPLGAHVNEQF